MVSRLIGALTAFAADVCQAEEWAAARRVLNRSGWSVPGLKALTGRKPSSTAIVTVDGIKIEKLVFSNLPIWNDRERRYLASRVVFAFSSGDAILIQEHELVAHEIEVFRIKGRTFACTMLAYPCSADTKAKTGGCAGADHQLVYIDEDGDGEFEVMEFAKSIITPGSSRGRPPLPKWAVELGTRE